MSLVPCDTVLAMSVAALAGGVGGAKLLVGLQRVLGSDLTAIVNTGDDATIYGSHVSPDVDIVTYWLAGIADTSRGWGIAGDTFEMVDMLRSLGAEAWFSLGDRDGATCLYRTAMLAAGATLTAATHEIRRALQVPATILPMTDDPVRTKLDTLDGRTLDFQTYFVKERCEPEIVEIRFDGVDGARPGPDVLRAIREAERVIVCPSNPLLSIAPILALPGIREELASHAHVIAVSPIVEGAALKGPADRLLARLGHDVSASGVAALYADFCDRFVVDERDISELGKVEATGVTGLAAHTIMSTHDVAESLARVLLA